jgi:hypothetical protein
MAALEQDRASFREPQVSPDTGSAMPETSKSSIISQLKARYAANTTSPDGARTRQAAVVGTLVGLVLLGGYQLTHQANGNESASTATPAAPTFIAGQFPACDAPIARQMLQQAIEANTSPLLGATKVQQITEITDAHVESVKLIAADDPNRDYALKQIAAMQVVSRDCLATFYTSRGKKQYNYIFTWTTPAKDNLYIEATPLTY